MHGVTMERVARYHKGDEVGKPRREVPMTEEQNSQKEKKEEGGRMPECIGYKRGVRFGPRGGVLFETLPYEY